MVKTRGVKGVCGATQRVDEPDIFDSHGKVVGKNTLGTREAIFGRKYLNADQWRSLGDTLTRRIRSKNGEIANAYPGRAHPNALLDNGSGTPELLFSNKERTE